MSAPTMHIPTPHEIAVAKRYESKLFLVQTPRSIRRWSHVRGWLSVAAERGEVRRPLRESVLVPA